MMSSTNVLVAETLLAFRLSHNITVAATVRKRRPSSMIAVSSKKCHLTTATAIATTTAAVK